MIRIYDSKKFIITLLLGLYFVTGIPMIAVHVHSVFRFCFLCGILVIFATYQNIAPRRGKMLLIAMVFVAILYIIVDRINYPSNSVLLIILRVGLQMLPVYVGYFVATNQMEDVVKIIVPLVLVLFVINAVTTTIGQFVFPNSSRILATGNGPNIYYYWNIGGYDFVYLIAITHPLLIYLFRKKQKTILAVLYSILAGFCLYKCEYSLSLMLWGVGLFSYMIPTQKGSSRGKLFIPLILIIGAFLLYFAPDILNYLAKLDMFSSYSEKFLDFAKLLSGQSTTTEDLRLRKSNYNKSLDVIAKNWLFGGLITTGSADVGGHSGWLDAWGRFGLFGLAVYTWFYTEITLLYSAISKQDNVKWAAFLSILLALINAALNPTYSYWELGLYAPLFIVYIRMAGTQKQKLFNIVKEK